MHRTRVTALLTMWGALALFLFVATAAADGRGIFYVVRSKDSTACLLGSVHVGSEDFYPLSQEVESCFKSAPLLVLELDPAKVSAPAAQKELLRNALYAPGDELKKHVAPDTYKRAVEEWSRTGLPEETVDRFRPWMLALTLQILSLEKKGMTSEQGVEQHYIRKGKGEKRIGELESADFQLQLLNGFSEKEQELFLLDTLRNLSDDLMLDAMVRAWRSGEVAALEETLMQPLRDHPELASVYDKLFFDRNRSMAAKIDRMVKEKARPFVIVGAGHLLGPKGVVELLRAKGYTVEQR